MTTLRFFIAGERAGPKFQRLTARDGVRVRAAARAAAHDAAADLQERGRADIAGAGNFGSRWTDGFHVDVSEGGGNIRIAAVEDVPYWKTHQFGATIQGKPMLWIPFEDTDAKGVFARDYPGGLFHVTRKADGLELLGSIGAAQAGDDRPIRYFGKESVTIPKRFHLIEIARDVARKMRDYYNARFR